MQMQNILLGKRSEKRYVLHLYKRAYLTSVHYWESNVRGTHFMVASLLQAYYVNIPSLSLWLGELVALALHLDYWDPTQFISYDSINLNVSS